MPRRMKLSHEEMRARAVTFAHEIVVADGVAGLTVRRVAALLGCSVGTVYNLFRDLDDIVLHVAARVVDDLRTDLFAPGLPAEPVAALVEIARRYIRFSSARPKLWALVFEWRSESARPTPRWHLERIAGLIEAVRHAAAPAFTGRADAGVITSSIEVLWASVHGIAVLAGRGKLGFVTPVEAEALAERLIVTYLRGVV